MTAHTRAALERADGYREVSGANITDCEDAAFRAELTRGLLALRLRCRGPALRIELRRERSPAISPPRRWPAPFTNPPARRLHAGSLAGGDPVAQSLLWNIIGRSGGRRPEAPNRVALQSGVADLMGIGALVAPPASREFGSAVLLSEQSQPRGVCL